MKKSIGLFLLAFSLSVIPANADQTDSQNPAYAQAREDYRAYLQQLKELSKQYKQITGEITKVAKEEGVPSWDEATGEIQIKPYVEPLQTLADGSSIQENEKEMIVSVDLPGFKRNSIEVKLREGNVLHLTAQKKTGESLEKTIKLPSPAQEKGVRARYEDGVLTVHVPRAASKEITVPVS